MHSATKYLGGHSDVIAGALIIKIKIWEMNCILNNSQPEEHLDQWIAI